MNKQGSKFNPVVKTKTQLFREQVKKESINDLDKLTPRYVSHPKYSLNKDHSLHS